MYQRQRFLEVDCCWKKPQRKPAVDLLSKRNEGTSSSLSQKRRTCGAPVEKGTDLGKK